MNERIRGIVFGCFWGGSTSLAALALSLTSTALECFGSILHVAVVGVRLPFRVEKGACRFAP